MSQTSFTPINYRKGTIRFSAPKLEEFASSLMYVNDLMKSGRVGAGMKVIEDLLDATVLDWRDHVNLPKQPMV